MLITVKTHLWQQQCVLSSRNASILEITKLCATMGMSMIQELRKPSLFSGVLPQEGREPQLPSPPLPQLP